MDAVMRWFRRGLFACVLIAAIVAVPPNGRTRAERRAQLAEQVDFIRIFGLDLSGAFAADRRTGTVEGEVAARGTATLKVLGDDGAWYMFSTANVPEGQLSSAVKDGARVLVTWYADGRGEELPAVSVSVVP